MSRRVMAMVVIGALALSVIVVAGLLAAATRSPKPVAGDFMRCPATCNTLIKYYGEKRPTMKTHDGDQQCWQTCDARFNGATTPAT